MTSRITSNFNSTRGEETAGKEVRTKIDKSIVHRTRFALGDIGNRLITSKGGSESMSTLKKEPLLPAAPRLKEKTGLFRVPVPPPPKQTQCLIKKTNLQRSTSSTTAVNPKTNLYRSHSSTSSSTQSEFACKRVGAPVKSNRAVTVTSSASLVLVKEGFLEEKKIVVKSESGTTAPSSLDSLPKLLNGIEGGLVSSSFSASRYEVIDTKADGTYCCPEYAQDISIYLHKLEKKYCIPEDYLKSRSINAKMRSVLIDWLTEVHLQFEFDQDTLYMAKNLLDRYLLNDLEVTRNQLQLVGVTCLYIAAKFEEVVTPQMSDFAVVCDNAFSQKTIQEMEIKIYKTLEFNLCVPLPVFFLRRCAKAANATIFLYTLAKYIMELSLAEYALCHVDPSKIAAASLALSNMILNKTPIQDFWNKTVQHYSFYSLKDIKSAIVTLAKCVARAHEDSHLNKANAVTKKYSHPKLQKISKQKELKLSAWKDRINAELLTI